MIMLKMATSLLTIFIALSVLISEVAADICYGYYHNSYLSYSYSYYFYCAFGCCGYFGNEHCCSSTGPVAGIIFGMIAFIAIIVILIICRRRRLAGPGIVVRTGGVSNAGFITTSTMSSQATVVHPPPAQYPGHQQPYPMATGGYPQQPPPYYPPKQ